MAALNDIAAGVARYLAEKLQMEAQDTETVKFGLEYLFDFAKCRGTLLSWQNVKLKVSSNEKSTFINIPDIVLITRNERKTTIHVAGGSMVQTYEPLHNLEKRLKKYRFFRCHKGFIVNPDMVMELSPWGNKTYLVKLSNTKETALMTLENAKEFHRRYCLE
jgi:DNA-binding LytR/AlgR family response regulator